MKISKNGVKFTERGEPASWMDAEYTYGAVWGGSTELDTLLRQNLDKVTVFGFAEMPNASYEFDEYALFELKNKFYVAHTSGCSCPSHEERAAVYCKEGFSSLSKLKRFVEDGGTPGVSRWDSMEDWAKEKLLADIEAYRGDLARTQKG